MPPLECQGCLCCWATPNPVLRAHGEGQETPATARGHPPCLSTSNAETWECPLSRLCPGMTGQAGAAGDVVGLKDNSQDLTLRGTQGHSREPRSPENPQHHGHVLHQERRHRRKGSRRRTLRLSHSSGLGSVDLPPPGFRRDSAFLRRLSRPIISRSRWRKDLGPRP